jgi:hypothetical protein
MDAVAVRGRHVGEGEGMPLAAARFAAALAVASLRFSVSAWCEVRGLVAEGERSPGGLRLAFGKMREGLKLITECRGRESYGDAWQTAWVLKCSADRVISGAGYALGEARHVLGLVR